MKPCKHGHVDGAMHIPCPQCQEEYHVDRIAELEAALAAEQLRCKVAEERRDALSGDLAAERAAKEAAQNSDEHNFNRWQQAERERDAALAQAAAVQEECAKVCDARASLFTSAVLKADFPINEILEAKAKALVEAAGLIRSLAIAPEAGRNVAEDAARFVYYCKVLYDYSLQADWPDSFRDAETIDQLRAAIDAARKGEKG